MNWVCLRSPVIPAFGLVLGFFFFLIVLSYLGIEPNRGLSTGYFAVTSLWIAAVVADRRKLLDLDADDLWFALFVGVLLVSCIRTVLVQPAIPADYRFIPVFVLLPWLAGRVFCGKEAKVLAQTIRVSSFVLLPLLVVEMTLRSNQGYFRVWLFGLSHGELLVAGVLAFGLVAFVAQDAPLWRQSPLPVWRVRFMSLVFMLGFGLGAVTARGYLLVAILAVVLIMLLARSTSYRIIGLITAVLLTAIIAAITIVPHKAAYVVNGIAGGVNAVARTGEYKELPDNRAKADATVRDQDRTCAIVFGDETHPGNSVAGRIWLWGDAFRLFSRFPLAGAGAGKFSQYSCGPTPHSTVLQAFAELGILGGVPFLMLMLLTARIMLRTARTEMSDSAGKGVWDMLGIFLLAVMADQIYGNYLQAGLFFLMCGIARSRCGDGVQEGNAT